jgi:beta-glucosidase
LLISTHTLCSTNLKLSSGGIIGTKQNFTVTVTVTNTGKVDGKEVVQVRSALHVSLYADLTYFKVYMTDQVSSVATPNQELVGFQKISLK